MKILLQVVLVAHILIDSFEAKAVTDPKYFSNRAVEIEWDSVPEATQYDLEIYDGKNKKFIKTFTSKTNIFKLNIKMGKYFFRSRVLDKFDRSSDWTELAELLIAPHPTKFKNKLSEPMLLFADKTTGKYEMPIAWEPIPGIESYKISLETLEGKLANEFIVKDTSAQLKIPPGQYQLRVRAVLADGTIGDPSEPTSVLSVLGAKIQVPTLQFKKLPIIGQTVSFRSELDTARFSGELFYKPLEGNDWQLIRQFNELKERQITFDNSFKPGNYKLRLQAISKGFTPSDFGESEFVVKPLEKELKPIPEEASSGINGKFYELKLK